MDPRPSPARANGVSTLTVALGGDLIGPIHPMNRATDPAFAQVADLFRSADAGFVNQENAVFDMRVFTGFPAAETGGGYPVRLAAHARDVRDMGAGLVSVANNHATDFGSQGLVETLRNLAEAGVVAGGAGLSEAAARSPVYLDTGKGAVALVATASTFTPSSVAGEAIERQGTMSLPRPGISPLHVRKVRIVPPALLRAVQEAGGPLALREGDATRIGDQLFREGAEPGLRWEMKPSDESALLDAVGAARKRAALVLFSIHAHETAGDAEEPPVPYQPAVLQHANEAPSPNDPRPASFEVELFHAVIDRGGDVVARHGPHVIGGIELYKGRPIFYGLGSLFLDFAGAREFPTPDGATVVVPDSWFDGFVPVCTFVAGRLTKVTLHPLAIESGAGARSGSPSIARGERARSILLRLRDLSRPFGTRIRIEGDIGVIDEIPS